MNTLPSSIEESLKDAGFSATEILILRRLIEDRSLTLRQLAAKTGKSTGVLDQAMKKLLRRNVVTKDVVNDNPVFTLVSLEAITRAMEEDMEEKSEMLKRRFENFEAFVQSLTFEQARPDTEYFEGADGIKRCYCKLLGAGKEIIGYIPVLERSEDDPLEMFSSEFFRERRRRNIFSRIIAHDTPAGRKYQGRDPFEYRKTLLMSERECPFSFEKLIIGDSVVCINHQAERACIIHFPELAQTERALFETLWRQKSEIVAPASPREQATPSPMIPLKIRLYSELREFATQPKNWAFLGLALLVSVGVGLIFQHYAVSINIQRVQEQARSIAATASSLFDPADISALKTATDISKPEYARLVYQLNEVRRQNSDVRFAYILRKSDSPGQFSFVADADSISPFEAVDLNSDGKIDSLDMNIFPGLSYENLHSNALREGFEKPAFDQFPDTDQWGTFYSGAAPIKDAKGITVAIVGVDILASKITEDLPKIWYLATIISSIFLAQATLIVLFRLNILAPFFGRLKQYLYKEKIKLSFGMWALSGIFVALLAFSIYLQSRAAHRVGEKLQSIASTAATNFDVRDIQSIHNLEDMRSDAYQRTFHKLQEIRRQNPLVRYAFILRPSGENLYQFIADADSNYFVEFLQDQNNDGVLNGQDMGIAPGTFYAVPKNLQSKFREAHFNSVNTPWSNDQWGAFVSGMAPIMSPSQGPIALLAVDAGQEILPSMSLIKLAIILSGAALIIVLILRLKFKL